MPFLRFILCVALPTLLSAAPGYARDKIDDCQTATAPDISDLPAALAEYGKSLNENYGDLLKASELGQDLAFEGKSSFCNVDMTGINLRNASLPFADFRGALLTRSDLSGAILERADLTGAELSYAKLNGAQFLKAKLRGADLTGADLRGADLSGADLSRADLQGANLEGAILYQTLIADAKLADARLSGAQYEPRGMPSSEWVTGLHGISRVSFCEGEETAMVRLRAIFRDVGLRKLEREATFAIEHHRTAYALAGWDPNLKNSCGRLKQDRWAAIEGAFRLVFFEWTTGYGLAYGRPILILLGLIGVFTWIYLPVLLIPPKGSIDSGIFRIWPEGRITQEGKEPVTAKDAVVERLNTDVLSALGLALYFSVVSAFHLGWRDLNVGTWIARLQPREYALRAKGWVRVVSGTQSLLSVYLIAMWVLTYFGRPFE